MSELNCMNCCIGRFKYELCDCDGEFCKKFKAIGSDEDFENSVLSQISKWIPCSERLPEERDYHPCNENYDGAVLWSTDKGLVGIGWYYEITGNWSDLWDAWHKERYGNVVAWMPLPEPYKGASDAD